jgi:hypothetical protein
MTRRKSVSLALMPEEGADGEAKDRVIEKMLEQFGSFVKAFKREHGIHMAEKVSKAAPALFEISRWLMQLILEIVF